MNRDNLHALIDRYEENLVKTMGTKSHEQFKWEAVKIFRDAWFAPDAMDRPFSELFNQARKGCGWLIDNSRICPTSGIVKLAEAEPQTVKTLFTDLLFAADQGNLRTRQEHMDDFVDQIELLRQKYYPKSWKYKHDRHAASCYLNFFSPEDNYIYRASDANMMAYYIGFEKPLGSGRHFDLAAYYEMCDILVQALREHESLLTLHRQFIDENCYQDDSLHLMAFDLMYCCRCYGYYHGMSGVLPPAKKSAAKQKTANPEQNPEEKRTQILATITGLQEQLLEAQTQVSDTEFISLLGIEVTASSYGTGTIVQQEENTVTVQFDNVRKTFVIHKKYQSRPQFEDDQQIVDLLSERADILEKIKTIQKKIEKAQLQLQNT